MIKAVLFDLDMTLLDRDQLYRKFAEDLLSDLLPADLPEETFRQEVEDLIVRDAHGYEKKSRIYQPLFDKYNLSVDLDWIITRWTAFTRREAACYPEAKPLLDRLEKTYRLGVITNGEDSIQRNKMFSAGLEGRFEVALVSGSLGVEKPDPAIFNMALETMQISSEEAVYVGDQWVNDVQGALSAGLKAIWIHEQPADRELPDGLIRISRLSELEDALKLLDASTKENWPDTLVRWYIQNQRDLPWRHTKDPYAVWVSEIMLQQTRVEAVKDYYERFMKLFPTVQDLADAPEETVLKAWEGLGYYSRARNLQKAAKQIAQAGAFPTQYDQIRALPGIGNYTAGAIASIAFNGSYAAVDGNVLRVFSRLYAIHEDIAQDTTKKWITELDQLHIPEEKASFYTQALMDLGAGICIPKTPRCELCPIRSFCRAAMKGITDQLPNKKRKTPPKQVQRKVWILWKGDQILLCRRPAKTVLGGLWEFPGLEEQQDENAFCKEFGLTPAETMDSVFTAEHTFTHIHWIMQVFEAAVDQDPVTDRNWRWIKVDALDQVMIPTAFRKIVDYIRHKAC